MSVILIGSHQLGTFACGNPKHFRSTEHRLGPSVLALQFWQDRSAVTDSSHVWGAQVD